MHIKLVFLIILFSLFGLTGVLTFMYSMYTFNTLKKWELTAGIIVNTFISEEMVESTEGGMKKMYKPNIKYEYMADDVKYYHNDVTTIPDFNKYYGSMKDAQNYLNNYKIGENIDILYNKNNPEHSMLKNKIYEIRLFLTILSFSFLLVGITGLLLFNKYYKSRQH